MNTNRLQQRIQQFRQALARLEDACAQPENEFIRDAVIQRFEFTFELGWKMLRLKLQEEGVEANTPRAVIREAVAAGWLEDGNRWSLMLQKRNETSHTYDDALARQVYHFICKQARPSLRLLQQQSQTWS